MSFTLRVSVLDQCQLRCNYCLPQALDQFLAKETWLTLPQYEKIAKALLPLKIEKVRFTGGEPLLRKDLPAIIKIFGRIISNAKLAVTTNGLRFVSVAYQLVDSGISAVTFHLDTLKEERYKKIMGPGEITTVLKAISYAQKVGLKVKINMVVQKDLNDDELWDFLLLSQKLSVQVRFIELMNTGSARDFVSATFISGSDIINKISRHSRVIEKGRKQSTDPAELFFVEKLGIDFGLIASDTRPFCGNCNRLRLSADGRLRTCLYEPVGHGLGLKSQLMPSDEELMVNIMKVIAQKMSFHPAQKKARSPFSMSQIGG